MQLFKSIHIDHIDTIINRALALVPENKKYRTGLFYIDDNKEKFLSIPQLSKLLSELGLLEHVSGIAVYVVYSGTPIIIHRDSGDITYSLNIPLSGCENTFVNFYDTVQQNVPLVDGARVNYFSYDPQQCQLIQSLEMTTPHLINVSVPHAVVNGNNQPRITLLIRLRNTAGKLL